MRKMLRRQGRDFGGAGGGRGLKNNDAEETVWLLGKDEESKSPSTESFEHGGNCEEKDKWPRRLPGDRDAAKTSHVGCVCEHPLVREVIQVRSAEPQRRGESYAWYF